MMYVAERRTVLNIPARVKGTAIIGATAPSILEVVPGGIKARIAFAIQDVFNWDLGLLSLSEGSLPF